MNNRWTLDTSFFINGLVIGRIRLVVELRKPVLFSEYVYRFELGARARPATRDAAYELVDRNQVLIESLTIGDLERIASIGAPRRIGMGEISSAIIAERERGGVLCDDWKARTWLERHVDGISWESIEEFLLDAADNGYLTEVELREFQDTLKQNRYDCRVDMPMEFVKRLHTRQVAARNVPR